MVRGRKEGQKEGTERGRKNVPTSSLVQRASQEESLLLNGAGSAFGSFFFLVVKRGSGPVIAVCLSSLSLLPTFSDQVCLLSYRAPDIISAPSSVLLLAPFLLLLDFTLNFSFSHLDQFEGRKKETSPH